MKIAGKEITYDAPPLFVAELSCNHQGSIKQMLELIDDAQASGADFVKFQCYQPESMTLLMPATRDMYTPFLIKNGPWAGRTYWDLYSEAQTPFRWFKLLAEYCELQRVKWFASVFDMKGLALLEQLDCSAYKIASPEIVDLDLIQNVAETGKPMIISTGMANEDEIKRALRYGTGSGTILMHCVSGYPTAISDSQLRTIDALKRYVNLSGIGLSDHSMGSAVPIAATAMGVVMIEKHLRVSTSESAPKSLDFEFSMDWVDFQNMVNNCHGIWEAIHDPKLRIHGGEIGSEESTLSARRSLFVVRDIKKGEGFTRDNVRAIRPNGGLAPYRLMEVLKRVAARDLSRGKPLVDSDLGASQ